MAIRAFPASTSPYPGGTAVTLTYQVQEICATQTLELPQVISSWCPTSCRRLRTNRGRTRRNVASQQAAGRVCALRAHRFTTACANGFKTLEADMEQCNRFATPF